MKRTSLLILPLLLCLSCGQAGEQQGNGTAAASDTEANTQETQKEDATATQSNAVALTDDNAIRMEKHIVRDNETNMDASSYLIPKGWKAEENLYWFMQDNIVPFRYEATIQSPDGQRQIQYLPRAVSNYFYNAMKDQMEGIEPPQDAQACLRDLVLPYNRKGVDYKIVEMKPFKVDGIPQQGAYEPRASGATATIEYEKDGQTYQEEFTVSLFTLTAETPAMDMQGNMMNRPSGLTTVDQAFAVRAPKGQLDETRKLALACIGSVKPELAWYNQVQQVSAMLQKQFYQNLAAQNQRSKILAQTNREISQNITSSWEKQQESQDRQHHNFINYIRDVDDYKTPESNTTTSLPSGYSNVYTNGSEYILTNTQYDPSRDVNQTTNWTKMETANP